MQLQKQAFIILAHKQPAQVEALVQQLRHENLAYFFLHVDKKADATAFQYLQKSIPHLTFTPQHRVEWGSASMLYATLDAVKSVIDCGENFSHVHLLSGEDILLKPSRELYEFFSANAGTSFLNHNEIPVQWKHRYQIFHFGTKKERSFFIKALYFMYKRLAYLLPFMARKLPYNFKPYIGSQWWSLSLELTKTVYEFAHDYPLLLKFMKYVQIPDEMFFQTIIANHFDDFNIKKTNLRCMNWSSLQSSPAYLTKKEVQSFKSTGCFFARKIDFSKNAHLYTSLQELPK